MKKLFFYLLAVGLMLSCSDSDDKTETGNFPVKELVAELQKLDGFEFFTRAVSNADWSGVNVDKITVLAVPDNVLAPSSSTFDVKRQIVNGSVTFDSDSPGKRTVTTLSGEELEVKRRRQGGFFVGGVIVSESFDTNNQILIHELEEALPANVRVVYSMITNIYLPDRTKPYAVFTYDDKGRVETFTDNWEGFAQFSRGSGGNVTQAVMKGRTIKYTATLNSVSKVEIENSTMTFNGTHQVRTYTATNQKNEKEYYDNGLPHKHYDNIVMDTIYYMPGEIEYSQSNFLKALPHEWVMGNKLDYFFCQPLFENALDLYYCEKSPMFVKYNMHKVKLNGNIEQGKPVYTKIDYKYDDYFGDNYPTEVIIYKREGDGEKWDDISTYLLEYYDFVRIP